MAWLCSDFVINAGYTAIKPPAPQTRNFEVIMQRKTFLQALMATAAVSPLTSLKTLSESLPEDGKQMPVLFIGHGSPMNAIEENEFTRGWQNIAAQIPLPKAILFISAHWLTRGTHVTAMSQPKTIHDFGGFPKALFDTQYEAPGDVQLANDIAGMVRTTKVNLDHTWGLDHGAWSVAKPMYPHANIPTLQLSIDYNQPARYHYELAKELVELRKKGVLIIGSGNMVHNLGIIDFQNPDKGYDWAIELNETMKQHLLSGNHDALINYQQMSKAAQLAIPTPDHYYPLMYTLGLKDKKDEVIIFNDKATMGSITMTSVMLG